MLKKLAISLIILITLITAGFVYSISSIEFDYDFEKFFPESDSDTEYFNNYRKKFETDNDFVLVGIVNQNGVFRKDFLVKVDSLTRQLGRVKNIIQSYSITNIKEPIRVEFTGGIIIKKFLHLDTDSLMPYDSAHIMQNQQLVNTLITKDAQAITIYLKTTPYLSKAGSDSLANDINEIVDNYQFDEIHIAGRSTGQSYYVKLMQKELLFFIITSFLLVVIFLALSFRTVWGVAVPVFVVIFSVIWTIGTISLMGEGISLVLTVLPTILFVVGMSDSVHIIAKYLEELRSGKEKITALKVAYKEVASATFLTSFTTSVGFITLMFIPIEPVREFGQFTSLGILYAYILSFTLLPAVLVIMPKPKISQINESNTLWPKILRHSFLWLVRNKRKAGIGFTLIGVIAALFCTQLRFNNFLVEDLKESDPMKQNFYFFENKFAGVRPFEMGIKIKGNQKVTDLSILKELEKVEDYLRNEYNAGFLMSPVTIIKNVNKAYHTGSKKYYRLPNSQKELDKLLSKIEKYDSGKVLQSVMFSNKKELRISGKSADLGSAIFRVKNQALENFMKEDNRDELFEARVTGTAYLIDKNNAYLASNLVLGLVVSILIISLITAIMFRFSLKMILIALLPNMIPILLIGAIMSISNIDLKVSTSMIFAISFGIAVDDTIHFLSRLRQELNKGKSLMYAVKRTYFSTGKAIIITTIILSGGFLTLVFSEFLGTFYIGMLIGLTLIFAVIFDLLYLPVLLWWLGKDLDKKIMKK